MTDDGRALDDAEPQDIAREMARALEKIADLVERGGPDPDERPELVALLRKSVVQCTMWAEFGKWPAESRDRRAMVDRLAILKRNLPKNEDDSGDES